MNQTAASLTSITNPEGTGVVRVPTSRSSGVLRPELSSQPQAESSSPLREPGKASATAKPAAVTVKKAAKTTTKTKLMPREMALSAATILFLAITFIGFEVVHSKRASAVPAQPVNTTTGATLQAQANKQDFKPQTGTMAFSNDRETGSDEIAPAAKPKQRRPKVKVAARPKIKAIAKNIPETAPQTMRPPAMATKSDAGTNMPASLQNVKATTAQPLATATLELQIEYQFAEAQASVWLDNQLIYSQKLYGESKKRAFVFKKVEGRERHSIKIPAGQHRINVRIQSETDQYDQSQTISGNFAASSKSALAITCDKHGHDHELQLALQ